MTTTEMMYEFQSLLDTSVPAYAEQLRLNSDKIMMQLNIGYRRYILEKFLSSRDSNTNALTIQAHQDVLSNLIEVAHLPAVSISNGELVGIGYSVVLPDNYYYYVRGAVATTRADEIQTSDNSYSNLILTNSYQTFENAKTTRFNTPILREPISILLQDKLVILVDKWTKIGSGNVCTLTYLKTPKNLGFEDTSTVATIPEIAEVLHEDIVKYSYQLFMNNISFSNRVNNPNNDN